MHIALSTYVLVTKARADIVITNEKNSLFKAVIF